MRLKDLLEEGLWDKAKAAVGMDDESRNKRKEEKEAASEKEAKASRIANQKLEADWKSRFGKSFPARRGTGNRLNTSKRKAAIAMVNGLVKKYGSVDKIPEEEALKGMEGLKFRG